MEPVKTCLVALFCFKKYNAGLLGSTKVYYFKKIKPVYLNNVYFS